MPQMFAKNTVEDWESLPLSEDVHRLSPDGLTSLDGSAVDHTARGAVLLVRHGAGRGEEWLVICGTPLGVRVNGVPVLIGIHALRHRDEILVNDPQTGASSRYFLSTEKLARKEPFPSSDGPVTCPRCRNPIQKGQTAVQCPQCGVWHHQIESEHLNCWTYSSRCAHPHCHRQTELDGHYRWSPEHL